MSKSNAVNNSTASWLQKTKQLIKDSQFIKSRPQMPLYQIRFFLNQAFEKSKLIAVQTSKQITSDSIFVYEFYGIVTAAVDKDRRILLESPDKKTIALIKLDDIRHVRAVG